MVPRRGPVRPNCGGGGGAGSLHQMGRPVEPGKTRKTDGSVEQEVGGQSLC